MYNSHENFSDKDREERGVSSVKKLKETIKQKVAFIIAQDEETGEVVGASRLDFSPDEKVPLLWHNALYVKNGEKYRGKGIGSKILNRIDEIFNDVRQDFDNLSLQCGIEPDNFVSKEFHKKLGWENAKNKNNENFVYEQKDGGVKKKYELWEKKVN